MRLSALFPQFCGLRIDQVYAEPAGVTLVAATTANVPSCLVETAMRAWKD